MRSQIPNIITILNLICGCLAIVCVLDGHFQWAFVFFFIGGLADYFDGMIARWLQVHSPFGKELDSLADMITFGALPGTICYVLLSANGGPMMGPLYLVGLPGFLITAFAGIRLAKFNLDTRQADDFIGMPTPSCSIFIVGLMLIHHHNRFELSGLVTNPWFLYPVIVLLSYLLISEIRMFSFKFKTRGWKGNERRIIFLIIGVILMIALREMAFSLFILMYILYALFEKVKHFGNPTV